MSTLESTEVELLQDELLAVSYLVLTAKSELADLKLFARGAYGTFGESSEGEFYLCYPDRIELQEVPLGSWIVREEEELVVYNGFLEVFWASKSYGWHLEPWNPRGLPELPFTMLEDSSSPEEIAHLLETTDFTLKSEPEDDSEELMALLRDDESLSLGVPLYEGDFILRADSTIYVFEDVEELLEAQGGVTECIFRFHSGSKRIVRRKDRALIAPLEYDPGSQEIYWLN